MTFASGANGSLKLPLIAADEDSGPLVKALVEGAPGKNLIAYREWMSLEELVAVFSKVTGLSARYVTVAASEPGNPLPEGLKAELDDNWAYFNECGYEARDDPTVIHPSQVGYIFLSWELESRKIRRHSEQLEAQPELGTVSDWVQKQDWSFISRS